MDTTRIDETALNRYVAKVFGWMFLGLFVTAATVMFFVFGMVFNPAIADFLVMSMNALLLISVGQIVLVFVMSLKLETLRPTTVKLMYLSYSASMGIFFTFITLIYDLATLFLAFAVTAVSFGTMAIYGLVTKTDLTKMGNMLFMGLIGLIIAMVVNWFMGSSMLDLAITVFGLFIFLGLTAYKTNMIKHLYYHSLDANGDTTALTENYAVHSALSLYLSFINIFLFVLRLLSRD